MKFKVTFKDPDALHDCISDAAAASVDQCDGIEADEKAQIIETRGEKLHQLCRQWFRYGEYLTVEIDTEANTATVCKNADA